MSDNRPSRRLLAGSCNEVFDGECRQCGERIVVGVPASGFMPSCPQCGQSTYVGPRSPQQKSDGTGTWRTITLLETLVFVVIIVGAVHGGMFGFARFGWWGPFLGGPIGAVAVVVACYVGFALLLLIGHVGCRIERIGQRRRLRGRFGRYWVRKRASEWKALTEQLTHGQQVSGKVVCRFNSGVFIDTEHGFPAMLENSDSNIGADVLQADCGVRVSARVYYCDDFGRSVILTQKDDCFPQPDEVAKQETLH